MIGRRSKPWIGRGGMVATQLLLATSALANGQAEYVAPLDVPVSSAPGRPLPYPVVEEAQPRGTPANATETWPDDFAFLQLPDFAQSSAQQNAVGGRSECTKAIILRGSRIEPGKVTIPAGGLGYLTEAWPGALPLQKDVLCIANVPNTLVDIEQSLVTRKNVTLEVAGATALGSEIFRLSHITEFGDARSAVVHISALSGFDWTRLGTGSLEVSTTEPGWHAKTFHYGMHQGRVEEVGPKSVRFAWLSGLRTDSVTLAERREFAATVGSATDIPLSGGGKIRVVRVNGPMRQVELATPEGPKVLSANINPRGLPADTSARKKLIAVGSTFAVVLVPDASNFQTNRAHLEVYSQIRQFRHGNLAPDARAWKTYPMAHYTGAVVGIYWVNEQPLELTPSEAAVSGPYDSFTLTTAWGKTSELLTFQVQDSKGATSLAYSATGRKSINLLAGSGPTLQSILTHAGANAAGDLHDKLAQLAHAPKPQGPSESELRASIVEQLRQAESREDWLSPRRLQAAKLPAGVGLGVGVLLGFVFGRAGQKRRAERHRDS